ncbi:hypothetical protein CGRA01v4_09312 [Colletotrichum graminicola]|uniref:Uncharacterized protein n=1 Tax=Colletotrichum graminicola (strain M1.001 / M2 / FGSC 10212) TaxID=645133 RepID=E3QPG0_COLGM|nr:uncharacterized protein GLRG_07892 [Colletotrichum graminicola M1.001]EFQ32748.1 hypothetical protein GLRG_07892 [Colletotrichum graminicola M1.001]WDK18027.1 hypothetical protein CGRA01v4_09312 [Colletotrichum graminicola]
MRRRNSTKSGSTLTRSKSTASFRSAVQRLEHIDPVIAERDAHIAATLSFCRVGLASDPEIRPWLSRNHSRSGRMESWPEDPTGDDRFQHDFEENGIRRQQSVRFVRQGSRSKRLQSKDNDASSDADTIRRRNILKDVGNRTQTQSSGKVGRSSVSTYTTNYVNSLPPVDSFGPADECAPPPASYRHLRKSRSMFSPLNHTPATTYYFNDSSKQVNRESSLQPQFVQDMKENKSPTESMGLRAPKSASFLKLRGTASVARTSSRKLNDLAVHDAEETFRRNIEDQQKLKPRSSIFFPRTKKSQSTLGLRKSMREFGSDAHLADTANPLTVSKDASLRKKARKVSNSLKSKLKEIFGRSKKDKPASVANENEAVNVGNEDGMESEQDDPYMDIIDPVLTDECSISQVPSCVPSLHDACSSRRLRSRQGSIESIGSERNVSNEKSRVTSWTSSETCTLDSQSMRGGERDKQRLSVIKENGPHYSSSSFRRPGIGDRNPYELSPPSLSPSENLARSETSMDKSRTYPALIDRFRDTKQDQQKKNGLQHSGGWDWDLKRHGSNQLPKSYNEQSIKEVAKQKPPTIRCVLQDDDVFQDNSGEAAQIGFGIVTTNSLPNEAKSLLSSAAHDRQRSESEATLASQRAHPRPVASDGHGSPPSRSSTRHSEDITLAPRTLSTRSSAFFGSPTCQLFRTKSPYRKALQASIKESNQASAELRSPTISSLNLELIPTRRRPSLSEEDPRLAYSESIYSDELRSSRTTPQLNNKPAGPAIPPRHASHRASPVLLEPASFTGVYADAAIEHSSDRRALTTSQHNTTIARGTQLEPLTYTPTTPIDRTVSNASSVEWKTWLSANASKTDANLVNARAQALTEVRYSKPSMPRNFGHVRENAEIEDSPSPMSYKPTCPKTTRVQTPLRTMSHNPRQASSASRVEIGTKTPVFMTSSRDENAAPRSDGRVTKHLRGVYGPLTVPPRSSLRTTPSMPLIRPQSSRNNAPIKLGNSGASKMRSFDTMPKLLSAEVSPRPKSRSPITRFGRSGGDSEIQSSASSPRLTKAFKKQFGPLQTKENSNGPKGRSPRRKDGPMRHRLWDSSDYDIADRPDAINQQDKKPQTGEGKQMLEGFLSSRRQVSIMGNEPTVFL